MSSEFTEWGQQPGSPIGKTSVSPGGSLRTFSGSFCSSFPCTGNQRAALCLRICLLRHYLQPEPCTWGLCAWLLSLCMFPGLSVLHTCRCFTAECYSIEYTYGILLTQSASEGHLVCLHFGAIVTQASELS